MSITFIFLFSLIFFVIWTATYRIWLILKPYTLDPTVFRHGINTTKPNQSIPDTLYSTRHVPSSEIPEQWIKDIETKTSVLKARRIAQVHRDKWKNYLLHNSTIVRLASINMISSLSSSHKFNIWSHGVAKAYLQLTETLPWTIYLHPVKELNRLSVDMLLLLRPLYGLPGTGD